MEHNLRVSSALQQIYKNLRGRLIVPHQTDGVRWMLTREFAEEYKGGIVADEMGLGKTLMTLAVTVGNPLPRPTLVVAPKALVEQWATECEKFTGVRPLILRCKDLLTVDQTTLSRVPMIITTYDTLHRGMRDNVLFEVKFGRVVLDEAHAIKNSKTRRHKAANLLQSEIKWCLSGTPVTRTKRDFLSLIEFIGVPSTNYAELYEKYTMRRTFEDASKVCERLRLPPLQLHVHAVPFSSEEEKELYRDLAEEAQLRIAALENEQHDEENNSYGVFETIMRLRQSTTHPQLVCDGRKLEEWTGVVTKLDELATLIQAQPKGSKTLIFTHWTMEAQTILKMLNTRLGLNAYMINGSTQIHKRDAYVQGFNSDPTIDALVMHIDVGGVGLNLQAATHVYINSPDWSAASELQAIARAHRLGVDHVVSATRLVIKGTIDEYMLATQSRKLGFAADVLQDSRIRSKLDSPGLADLQRIRQFLEFRLE